MTQNNNPNSQAANANAATSNNQNPQKNATNAAPDTHTQDSQENSDKTPQDEKKKATGANAQELHLKHEPIELHTNEFTLHLKHKPIELRNNKFTLHHQWDNPPQKVTTIKLDSLADTLKAKYNDDARFHMQSNVRFLTALYFACVTVMSAIDIFVIKNVDTSFCRNCILWNSVAILHAAIIALLICCIVYVCSILKSPEQHSGSNQEQKSDAMRTVCVFLYCIGLAIYLIAALTAWTNVPPTC